MEDALELPTRIPMPSAKSPLAEQRTGSPLAPGAAASPLALGARIALHAVDNLQLAAATPAKARAAAVFTPLKQGPAPDRDDDLTLAALSPDASSLAGSPHAGGGGGSASFGGSNSTYRIACHLPAELRAAAEAGGGVLYHHPLSSLQGEGWCRELSPDYVLSAGWLEGRCSPIDGGSYTLAYGDDEHRQLNFVLRVGLADGVPPTSVSWRLRGLDDDARVLPATTRVAEASDGTPLACMYFDGLELLLARAETEADARHTVRLRLQRLGGRASSDDSYIELQNLDRDDMDEDADVATLCGTCPLSSLWAMEHATGWHGSGVASGEDEGQVTACLIAEVVESGPSGRTIGFARVPVSLKALLPQAFGQLLHQRTTEDGLQILRSLLQVVAVEVEALVDDEEPTPRTKAAPATDQISAAIDSVRAQLGSTDNPYAVGLGAALLLSQQHWPVVVLETVQSEVLVAVHASASSWQPLAPCLAAQHDSRSVDGVSDIEQLQKLLDQELMPFASVKPSAQTRHQVRPEIASGLDMFSLLLSAGFDLLSPETSELEQSTTEEEESGAPLADPPDAAAPEEIVRSFWHSSVRSIESKNGPLLPLLQGDGGNKLIVAAESQGTTGLLFKLLTQNEGSDSVTLRWFEAGVGDLSSPALLNTILQSCTTAFLQNVSTRDFDNFCQHSAVTYAADNSESFDCLVALGQMCIDSAQHMEDDYDRDSEPVCVPILFVPATMHSTRAGVCKITASGKPFLNPLLLAARPPKASGPASLAEILETGQPMAALMALPEGLPLGEPGRVSQQVSGAELLALDQAQWSHVDLLNTTRQLASCYPRGDAELTRSAPVLLAALDRDQESLTHWWASGSGPMAVSGSPGSGRTRSLANLAANVIHAGGRLLYVVPDSSAAVAFTTTLEEFQIAQFAVNLSHGPSAMRCLRERFAKIRELAGSQQSSQSYEYSEKTATYQRHCDVLATARERLQQAASSASPDNTQLYLRQFLDAQAVCMASAKDMVAAKCRARLLEAAQILTQGRRPDLAAACSELLTTDSTDDDCVERSAQFTELVLMLSPVVVATPQDVSVWLTGAPAQTGKLFDTIVIDDAQNMQPHEASRAIMLSTSNIVVVGTEAPQPVLSRLRKRGTSTSLEGRGVGLRHLNAYEVVVAAATGAGKLSPRNFGISFRGNYCSKTKPSTKGEPPSRLLPVPMRIKRVLGSSFVRVDSGGEHKSAGGFLKRGNKGSASKRSESRLGNNMDSALKAIQSALGAHRVLKDEAIEPLRLHLRAIRGGVVNIGEARDIGVEVSRIAKALPHSHIAIVTMSTAQMHLVEAVCKAAPSSTKQNTTVTVCTVFDLAAAGRCDVLLLSATYGPRSSIGGRGVSAQRLPALLAALCEAPRLQSIVFLSGGSAETWAGSQPSSGFPAKFGKALVQLARPAPKQTQESAAPWISELYDSLRATAEHEDDVELKDWTLLSLRFRDEVIPAIAHKSSIVLCHSSLDKSAVQLQERFCVLPQMVGRWRWKDLHHVFTPSSLDEHTMHELTSALVRDMCGLGRLVQLKIDTVGPNRVALKVVPKLSLSVPEDAIAALSLVRTSDSSSGQRVVPRNAASDTNGCIAMFVDSSTLLRPACEYFYDLRDNTRGETLQTVNIVMPSELPEDNIGMELAGVQSGPTAQLIADVSVGAPSLYAVKDSGYVYELKVRKNAEGQSDPDDSAVDWQTTIASDILTPDLVGNGMYEFVVDDLEQGQWYTVGVSVRNSVGRGPWTFSSVQMPDATIEAAHEAEDQFLDDQLDMDGGGFSNDDDGGDFDDTGVIDDLNATNALPDKPALQTDNSTGTISWPEVVGSDKFEVHARPWDVSAPAGKWRVVSKCHERRVVTARQLLREGENPEDGLQMEVRIRGVSERGNGSWSHTSVPIRGLRAAAKLSKIELQLCPAKRDVDIEVHVADLMMGGIMRLSAKIQLMNVVDGSTSRITARVSAAMRLTFADGTEAMLPMSLNKDEIQLSFKARALKTVDGQPAGQCWQASVRPVVSAPATADSSFWCLLYSAITSGAKSQLELTYTAGAPGSKFLPVGRQDFAVKLQQYDPMQVQRPDLMSQFVLPKHALVEQALEVLLQSWSSNAVDVQVMWSALTDIAAQCIAVQTTFVKAALAVASPTVNTQLIQQLEEMSSSDSVAIESGAWDCTERPESAAEVATTLLSSVIQALQASSDVELRPFPSATFVIMSLLSCLGSFRASRPQLGAIADYLQYRMHLGMDSCSFVAEYSVSSAVNSNPAPAITVALPPMVAGLVHNHGAEWAQYLSPLMEVDTDESTGLPGPMKQPVLDTLVALLLSGETVTLLDPADEDTAGWSFRSTRVGSAELIPSSSGFLSIGQRTELGAKAEPVVLIPVSMGRVGPSMAIKMKASTNMFFSPSVCTELLPLSGSGAEHYQCSVQKWMAAAIGEQHKLDCAAVLYVSSGERASDRTAESPILDMLQHHVLWSRSSTVSAYGLLTGGAHVQPISAPEQDSDSPPSLQNWQLSNPCQVGDADASQRHAIAEAVAGKSFVLRGPPGCGKTQTLANMVAALVDAGKTVCVAAKLPVALGVFAEKLRGMQQCSADTGPSLRPLSTAFFTGKDGGKIRLGDDGQNAITHDDRLQRWPIVRDLERFWVCEESGTESSVRALLREGWRLPPCQPEFLQPFQCKGIVGVQLIQNKHKPKFVCSLCGKTQASEAPFAKHMQGHMSREHWDPTFDQRQTYEATQWQSESTSAADQADKRSAAVSSKQQAAIAEKLAADSALHQLDVSAWHACRALHSGKGQDASRHCGMFSSAGGQPKCPGSGCCISEMSPFETVSSVANGAVRVAALQAADTAAAAGDLEFFGLAQQFAQCRECCDYANGCCHSVLETVHAVKGASHSTAFSILSLASSQVTGSGSGSILHKQVYQGLQDVMATQARLKLRCELFELAQQLSFLRNIGSRVESISAPTASGWELELQRRQACLNAVSVGCEARLLNFLLQHPHVSEEMEAAFGVRGSSSERARRLVELLYPSLLDANSSSDSPETDPAVRLRLLLKMFPVFCFTPEECARHLPAALPSAADGSEQPLFDVVLFDEASQLPTYEALGSLGRASQCIIIGDDQQLPPRDGCTGLLDDALVANMSLVPLTWHYRSAFRSLIHVSNEMFYHGSLQCVPSANDFLSTTGCNQGSSAGLIRQQVNGPMESNYNSQRDIQGFINKRLRRLDPTITETVHYSATPQGFVNSEQAWRVLEELTRYMDEIRADGRPMSAGIITLNRPQRQLIHLLVDSASNRLGLVNTHNNSFARPDMEAHVRDQPLFIASIDQIQGEEREIILLSMLLAPRRQASQNFDSQDDDEEGVDIFDQLEAGAAEGAPEDSDEEAPPAAAAAPTRAATAQRFQYSTIAHAHGDRLLNVGLSRAISVMKIFYHPRMVAPPEHDVKNGKRVFGWLVRFLLRQAPSCTCSECVERYRRLVPESAVAASADDDLGSTGDSVDQPKLWKAVESALQTCDGEACFGVGSTVGESAVGFGGGSAHIAVAAQLHKAAVPAAPPADDLVSESPENPPPQQQQPPKAIALLADSTAGRHIARRDRTSLPAMLQNRKVGWEHCATLRTEDLLQRLMAHSNAEGQTDADAGSSSSGALGAAVEGWVQDTLRESVSQSSPAVEAAAPVSLFEVPAAPVPVLGYVPPAALLQAAGGGGSGDSPGDDDDTVSPAAAPTKPKKEKKKAGGGKGGMTVVQLKEELKRRGLSRTGKKAELEARLQAAIEVSETALFS